MESFLPLRRSETQTQTENAKSKKEKVRCGEDEVKDERGNDYWEHVLTK